MTYRFAATALALAALPMAGCGDPDSGPRTMEEARDEAAKLDRPKPGQYKQTMTITEFEVPGAPPEIAEQFKQAVGQVQEDRFCLTREMADQGFKDMFQKVGEGGECAYERFDVSGGKLDAVLDCQSKAEGKARFALSGTVGPAGSVIAVKADTDNPNSPMGKAKIGFQMVSERLGDCAPAQ